MKDVSFHLLLVTGNCFLGIKGKKKKKEEEEAQAVTEGAESPDGKIFLIVERINMICKKINCANSYKQ